MEWQSCERCKHELKDGKKGSPCFDCGIEAKGYEPKTNADRIRNMSDEELAKFLELTEACGYNDGSITDFKNGHYMDMLEWLQAEVKEGENNA